jgi:nucleoside-diphosphate-sugar epimerase
MKRALITGITGQDGGYLAELPMANVGSGPGVSVAHLARLMASVAGYEGTLRFDASKPAGTLRKRLDSSRVEALGWQPRIPLDKGLRDAYEAYAAHRL